jgi:DNA-binding NarL/FixJ family response regulator
MFSLRHHGGIQGHLVIRFSNPIQDRASVEEIVLDYAIPLSLYLSLIGEGAKSNVVAPSRDDTGADQLTARQLSILSGMVEGKTNHELATELGFSVSTIRHETMRIYQALAVSDRKEAARKALTLALI